MIATLHRITHIYLWKGIMRDVYQHVQECEVCQKNKVEIVASVGVLQSLLILGRVWEDRSMVFLEGHPPSIGKTIVLVVVDGLSNYAHFIPLKHFFSAEKVAQLLVKNVYKLHGLPQNIMSDRDTIFLS